MSDKPTDSNPVPRGPPPGATEPPAHVSQPKVYEVFNANALPDGSGQNTAGSRSNPGLMDAIKTVKLEDFKEVHKYPCVRESLLTGIGAGLGMGGIRAIFRGNRDIYLRIIIHVFRWLIVCEASIPKACNWAVGTFCFAGIANYEFCLYKRRLEKAYMRRATEIIDRKKLEKEKELEKKRAERRKAKEEADRLAEEAKKPSWKFWWRWVEDFKNIAYLEFSLWVRKQSGIPFPTSVLSRKHERYGLEARVIESGGMYDRIC